MSLLAIINFNGVKTWTGNQNVSSDTLDFYDPAPPSVEILGESLEANMLNFFLLI